MAAPMPLDAPVTTATLPVSLLNLQQFLSWIRQLRRRDPVVLLVDP
jgi:hypothetical protein